MNRSSTILIIIVAHQAAHHSRGHSLQQRTECCWGTLELPEGGGGVQNLQSVTPGTFSDLHSPLPRSPGRQGREVRASKGSICGVCVALNSCCQYQIAPKLKEMVGMRTIIFAQMASCSFCWNPIEEGRETYLGYRVAASGLKIVSGVSSISRDQLW